MPDPQAELGRAGAEERRRRQMQRRPDRLLRKDPDQQACEHQENARREHAARRLVRHFWQVSGNRPEKHAMNEASGVRDAEHSRQRGGSLPLLDVVHVPIGADAFTADQWGVGPTAVVVMQSGPWSYGALANHKWGVSGNSGPDESVTFLQPFVSKGLGKGVTATANLESTYDWTEDQWTVPLNLQMSKVTKLGAQRASLFGGGRAYLAAPDGGPDWGLRVGLTLIYPK